MAKDRKRYVYVIVEWDNGEKWLEGSAYHDKDKAEKHANDYHAAFTEKVKILDPD